VLYKVYSWCRGWYPSHALGLALLSLPALCALANFQCERLRHGAGESREFYLELCFFGVVHFTNLTALNNWVKSAFASVMAIAILVLVSPLVCSNCLEEPRQQAAMAVRVNVSLEDTLQQHLLLPPQINCDQERVFFMETVLAMLLLVGLVWVLNREFEASYRLSFYISLLSARDRRKMQNMKNQADWLLHNIIPNHVTSKKTFTKALPQDYSENHRDIGVVFANLVNFNELYDETFEGGREFLRVLNELISDFDEILDRKEFRNVEKIKTIGSTFMAASGINNDVRDENTHAYQHLNELMGFVLELQNSVDEFNQSLIEFDLVLRIGFNFGDVTAGVIGTTKLYYDIWGDAVNIASRMESTGIEGRVQVSQRSMHALSEWYEFEKRGEIFIKGKDNMTTYLLKGRKDL